MSDGMSLRSPCNPPRLSKLRWGRATVCAVVGLTGAACALLMGSATLDEGDAKRKKPLEWGLYQILWSKKYAEQLDAELAKFASKPHYVMFYRDLGRPFSNFAVDAIHERGATAIVSLELWSWHGEHRGSYLPLINAGKYDAFLRQWARDAKADGRRILLRFGFEPNGDWFTWSGDPKAYVTAWRRAHGIFKTVGAANVEWVWAPNIVSVPDTPDNDMGRYYPGDAYVDWVGIDGYNFGDHHDRWHRWQSFDDVFGEVLARFAKSHAAKPVMIAEFGCAPGKPGQRAQWIRAAYKSLQHRPQVCAVVWFNYDKRREKEPNWRIDVTPQSLEAFNETFAAPQNVER